MNILKPQTKTGYILWLLWLTLQLALTPAFNFPAVAQTVQVTISRENGQLKFYFDGKEAQGRICESSPAGLYEPVSTTEAPADSPEPSSGTPTTPEETPGEEGSTGPSEGGPSSSPDGSPSGTGMPSGGSPGGSDTPQEPESGTSPESSSPLEQPTEPSTLPGGTGDLSQGQPTTEQGVLPVGGVDGVSLNPIGIEAVRLASDYLETRTPEAASVLLRFVTANAFVIAEFVEEEYPAAQCSAGSTDNV